MAMGDENAGKIGRPRNAYILFAMDYFKLSEAEREEDIKEHIAEEDRMNMFSDQGRRLGEKWRELTVEERNRYERKSLNEKRQYRMSVRKENLRKDGLDENGMLQCSPTKRRKCVLSDDDDESVGGKDENVVVVDMAQSDSE